MIQLRDIKKVYRYKEGYTVALAGINLDVDDGEFVAISSRRIREPRGAEARSALFSRVSISLMNSPLKRMLNCRSSTWG